MDCGESRVANSAIAAAGGCGVRRSEEEESGFYTGAFWCNEC